MRYYGHTNLVNCLCQSADGTQLYSGDNNGKILIWVDSMAVLPAGVGHSKQVVGL